MKLTVFRASTLSLTLLFAFTACPPGGEDDGGAGDGSAADGGTPDTAGQDTGFDAGCEAACGTVTGRGECEGAVLRYCESTCLKETDCSAQAGGPYTCGLVGNWHDCLAGEGQACEPDYWGCDPATTCNGNYPCDPQAGLSCVDEVCRSGAFDAGPQDVTAPDTTVADVVVEDQGSVDTFTPEDAAVADVITPDVVTFEDAAVEDVTVVEDAATAPDVVPVEDAATGEDVVTVEDSGSAEDAS